MGYYNGKKVLSVVRAGFKGGSLTLSAHGRYIPQDYGLEGFTDVINEAPETPTDVLKYIEGDNIVEYLAFGTNVSKIAGNFQCFPNLETIYIQNATEVLDIVSNAWDGTKVVSEGEIIVPNNLLSAYQSRYPNWNFTSWQYQTEFTIPFIGETTLTAEYIQNVVNMTGGYINVVNKVIVPIDFTEYESGAIARIQQLFTSLRYLETTYPNGVLDIDFEDSVWQEVLTRVTNKNKTLDSCLVSARNFVNGNTTISNYADKENLCIVPPREFSGNPNAYVSGQTSTSANNSVIYIANQTFTYSQGFSYLMWIQSNLYRCEFTFKKKILFEFSAEETNLIKFNFEKGTPENQTLNPNYGINRKNYNYIFNGLTSSFRFNSTTQTSYLTSGAWHNLIVSLGTPTTTQTITMTSNEYTKISQADIDLLTSKNWTLSVI